MFLAVERRRRGDLRLASVVARALSLRDRRLGVRVFVLFAPAICLVPSMRHPPIERNWRENSSPSYRNTFRIACGPLQGA